MQSLMQSEGQKGLWYRQFEPAYDFPSTPIVQKVALLTTPRCGSHFLGHQLHASGSFGYPLEYLNPGNWREWRKRARSAEANDTLEYIKSVRTGPNGVFVVKLHYEHLSLFLENETEPLSYAFVRLSRRDLIAQAVSFARAQQTGSWISDMKEVGVASYDFELISKKLIEIMEGNAGWASFLAASGSHALDVAYEEVSANPRRAIEDIAAFAGIALSSEGEIEGFVPRRQSKRDGADDWRTRFLDEYRERISTGRPVPLQTAERRKPLPLKLQHWAKLRLENIRG